MSSLATAATAQSLEDPVFKVGTLVISAPVTVFDRDDRLVNGLEAKDFTLLDNGIAQDIKVDVSYVPISLVVAIQANNVVEPFLPTIKKLGSLLEGLVIGEQGECAVMAFDHRLRTLTDGFVNDSNEVKRALAKINPGSSTSAMIDSVFEATRMLRNRPKDAGACCCWFLKRRTKAAKAACAKRCWRRKSTTSSSTPSTSTA